MNRFLYFAVSATDSACVPVSDVSGMEIADADTIELYYEGMGAIDNAGKITIDCTSGESKQAMNVIVNAMNHATEPFIVVSDVVNGVSLGHGLTVTTIAL